MEKVSIITPHFNSIGSLENALVSVSRQTYMNYEHIIIDDCSNEVDEFDLNALINKYPKTKLIRLKKNQGVAAARNAGVNTAIGRYVAFLDSDDTWIPEKIEKQLAFMQSSKCAFSFTSYYVLNIEGETNRVRIAPLSTTYRSLLKCNPIGCSTVVYDTKILGKVYMPNLRKRQDLAMWLQILKIKVSAKGIQEPLVHYHIGRDSLSFNKLSVLKYQWRVYRECEGLNFFLSIYYFLHYAYNGVKNHYF